MLTLTACDFFLNGEELKKELDQQIAYTNAPSLSVYLKADAELGEFLSDGEKTFKVGYDTEVQFTVNQESYVFEKLEAVVRNSPETSRSESVQFTEVESDAKKGIYKINVKVLKQVSDIMIRPVCTLLPKINSISPALEANGCNQDSTITIAFNKNMNPESFKNSNGKITGLSITNGDDEDLSAYFDEPYFASDNKTLVILPLCLSDDPKYLLPPDESKSSLTIKVNYTFVDVKDEDGLSFTENGTHSYKINKNFNKQEEVTVIVQNPDSSYGSFLSAGEKSCIVGFGFEIEFTLNTESYIFEKEKLEAVSKNDTSLSRADCVAYENEQYDDETGVYRAKVRVLQAASDILIRPKCTLIENAEVTITKSEKGTKNISPADGTKVQSFINRSYSVSITPDEDYEFIRWELYDIKTDSSIANGTYVKLEDPAQPSTNYSVTQVPDTAIELALRPVVAERPQIISYSPMTLDELKDSSIQVLFDYDMDEGSIYYSDDELESLIADVGEENLLSSTMSEGKYYGYKKDGKTFFKNISFEDNDSYENITECFDEPFFATPRLLNINTSKENKLPDFTQVLVTIEKDFFYKANYSNNLSKSITMVKSKKWVYQVNDMEDTDAPRIVDPEDVKVFINSGENLTEKKEITSSDTEPVPSENMVFNRDKKITLNIKVTDTGSGPASTFYLFLTKVQDENYEGVSSPEQKKSVKYQRVTSRNGIINSELELDTLFGEEADGSLSDGVYKMNFEFSDRSGKTITYPENESYYFTVDNDISMDEPVFTDTSDSSSIKMKFEWTRSKDHKKTEIRYKKNSADQWSEPNDFTTVTFKEYNSLELATDYDFEITNYDYAGNKQVHTLTKTSADWIEFSVTGTPSKTIYLSGESFDKTGLTATVKLSNENIELSNDKSWTVDSYTTDLGTAISTGKTVTISYTYGGKTKSVELPQKYYIAASDALTQKPKKLKGYSGTLDGGTYYKFGDFPQTIASHQEDSYYTPNTIYNDWYLGNDGYFYEKCTAKIYTGTSNTESDYTCTDKTVLADGTDYYFRVEPIKWRVLNPNSSDDKILFAEAMLTANISYYSSNYDTAISQDHRKLNDITIMANNYKYSNIRAYLNGTANQFVTDGGTATSDDIDWTGKGFLQTAFTPSAQGLISETIVDNTPASTNPASNSSAYNKGKNNYSCDVTKDKIFLLSEKEATDSSYSFAEYNQSGSGNARIRKATDYAKANYVYQSTNNIYGGSWWQRSPYYGNVYKAHSIGGAGDTDTTLVCYTILGIVPALCISSSDLPE